MSKHLRVSQVADKLGIAVSTVWWWARESRHDFPKPVHIGSRISVWNEAEIEEWIAKRKERAA